jgi:fatty acid desaturase
MATLESTERAAARHPHPGESIPEVAWPTLIVGVCAVIMFALSTVAAIGHHAPSWVVITVNSAVAFVMFVVAHEGLHRSMSTKRWVNEVIGRLAWAFVVPMVSLSSYRYLHLQHHRHANDSDNDPDMFATHTSAWQLPFRWAFMEIFYAIWYARRLPERLRHSWHQPVAEIVEGAVVFLLYAGGIVAAIVTGHFWMLAVVVLVPQRIGIAVMGWWFDWLPHHGMEKQRENRYRSARIRVGMEWLWTPVMMSQNYHLMHHLHPWLPFYRYRPAWRRNEHAYLDHNIPVATFSGKELNSDEFRARKPATAKPPEAG